MLQNDFLKAGLKLDIRMMDFGELLQRAKAGEHDLVNNGWHSDNGDPDNFLTPLLGCKDSINGQNYAKWCNSKFEELIKEAKKVNDPEKRDKLYKLANHIFYQEQPWINLSYPKFFIVMKKTYED